MENLNISLNELAYRLIGLYRGAYKETDSLSLRLVKDWVHSMRAMFIKQRLDKPYGRIEENWIQTITPVPMEDIDSSTLPEEASQRKMLRTKIKIPPTIIRRGSIGSFVRIGSIDRLKPAYKVVSHETALVSGNGKFNRKDIYAFPLDGRIYCIAGDLSPKEKLDIRGVFQNPMRVPIIREDAKITHLSDDDDYPITREIVDQMEEAIVQSKFPLIQIPYKDTLADEADNLVQTTQRENE